MRSLKSEVITNQWTIIDREDNSLSIVDRLLIDSIWDKINSRVYDNSYGIIILSIKDDLKL